jgi:signal transduction histidine kinase
MNILLIDDDQPTLKSLQTFLAGTPYTSKAFLNPRDALDAFNQEHFDVVITDFSMPELNGIDVLRIIHEIKPDTFVMLLTGYANVTNAIAAVNHGAYQFLRKPLRIESLMPILEDIEAQLQGSADTTATTRKPRHANVQQESTCAESQCPAHPEQKSSQPVLTYSPKQQNLEMLGTFATSIIHDFNNRLSVIQPCVEMIQNLAEDNGVKRWAERLEKATTQAFDYTNHLTQIIHRNLDNEEHLPLCLEEVTKEVCLSLAPIVKNSITLHTDYQTEHSKIFGNFGQMCQIVMNLVSNAREVIPEKEHGNVTIRLHNVLINETTGQSRDLSPGWYVQLTVTDDGSGIHPDVLPRIFDAYFTTRKAGTGVGLAITRELITAHHGVVRVNSEVGMGTTVQVLLPCYDDATVKQEASVGT